jgi:hypothetical protein
MKNTLSSFFMLLSATAVLSSCEQCGNTIVTEPTPEDVEWLVYKPGDTVTFVTETSARVRYARTGIFAQTLPGEGFTATDECIEQVDVQLRTIIDDVAGELPSLGTRILSKPEELVVEVNVSNTGVWEINEASPTLDSVAVNGITYRDVYEIISDSIAADGAKHILFNKEFGFLKVEFFNGRLLQLEAE